MWTTRGDKESLAPMAYDPDAFEDDAEGVPPTETWWERRSPRLVALKAIGALAVGLTVASFTAVTILKRVEPRDGTPRLVDPIGDQASVETRRDAVAAAPPAAQAPISPLPMIEAPPPLAAPPMAPPVVEREVERELAAPAAPAAPVIVAQPAVAARSVAPTPRRWSPPRPTPAPPPEPVAERAPASDFPYDAIEPAPTAPAPAAPDGDSPYQPDSI